ncbi:unnamed protein product [Spirodela intermedia]|uniref:Uncharacterized protein n=1 Tax=Spirodela intermedia TaxID=51605 RepID=A0A7I8IML6_SPIIN|nr:unnamed protein product [Spirodela intermedia]CAA6658699.1 unnamed protein product [Spirodela intermedia]
MDRFRLHFLLGEDAPGAARAGTARSVVPAGSAGASRSFSSDRNRILVRDPSRRVVSLAACCGICLASFAAGIVAGIALKRRLQRWAAKLIKPHLRRWAKSFISRRLRRWGSKLLPPPFRHWAAKSKRRSKKD